MANEKPPDSVRSTPYAGCPQCHYLRQTFPSPLLSDAGPTKDRDGFDWNLYYWGFDSPSVQPAERKAIKRPLPHFITDSIPLELYEHIIHFLRGDRASLCSCSLVCRAWYYPCQQLLYTSVVIRKPAHFDTIVRQRSSFLNSAIRRLFIHPEKDTKPSACCFKTLPIAASDQLAHRLQCLILESFDAPYNRKIPLFMSRFYQLSHLRLSGCKLYSFQDLRRIVCALPSLLELALVHSGTVAQYVASQNVSEFMPMNHPHLRKIRVWEVEKSIMVPLGQWIAATEICSACTELEVDPRNSEGCELWLKPILKKVGCTLTRLNCLTDGLSDIGTRSFSNALANMRSNKPGRSSDGALIPVHFSIHVDARCRLPKLEALARYCQRPQQHSFSNYQPTNSETPAQNRLPSLSHLYRFVAHR